MDVIRASQFNRDFDLPDWRYILGAIRATFDAGSFAGATALANEIGLAAEAANHHPDIDIRYPALTRVKLITHASSGITQLDVDLAAIISEVAANAGATASPAGASEAELAIDAMDIAAVKPFWMAAFGYIDVGDDVLEDPLRLGPSIWFQQMDEQRDERNNIHIDVSVTHDVGDQRVAEVIAAGGRLVSDRRAPAFWILADPEGNEACICTWQARD